MVACGRSGSDENAEWLLREMREQGVTPNRISYSAAMFALAKAGRLPDVRGFRFCSVSSAVFLRCRLLRTICAVPDVFAGIVC